MLVAHRATKLPISHLVIGYLQLMDKFCPNWTKVIMHFASLLIQVVKKVAERFLFFF
jgi:hypothetical protein